jgi:hypothetical protein
MRLDSETSFAILFMEIMESEPLVRYPIAKWNTFLATRERGRRVREEIEAQLALIKAGDCLALDFAGVEGITVSFGDECVAKLLLARASGDFIDRGLVLEGANDDVHETLETVLERRKLAAVISVRSGEPQILGQQGWLPDTLAAALALRAFSAADLAQDLGITPQAANNRLKVLVASGAVARARVIPEGGGKEFSYEIAVPAYA